MDTESFYDDYPDVPPANIAPGPLAHGAEAVAECVNGEVVFRLRLKAPVMSQISPLLTQAEWRKINRDIDNASSFDLNIRNLEKPWEDVFLQLSTKSQYLVWRFKAEADNQAIVNLERSVRGSKGMIKELIPDIVNVLRLTLPNGHYEYVTIAFAELKRAISRQHTWHQDETGRFRLSYRQIPNSTKAVKILKVNLRIARRQVEGQALLQHCVRSLFRFFRAKMVLIAAVGPWFMVARRANCAVAWTKLRKAFPNRDSMGVLEQVGYKDEGSIDDDAADPKESPEKVAEDLRECAEEQPFDFSTAKRREAAADVRRHAVFEWDEELFNVREMRGWAVLEEIKKQIHDDIALFCDDRGEMIAMRVDIM
ncbi:hypothetical protein BDZ89DRAFT_1077953 [Hymenopellis radicata]|nr:hypothetical protein BDZ89DRAFT_1077953 [Hymenopellis radicata]